MQRPIQIMPQTAESVTILHRVLLADFTNFLPCRSTTDVDLLRTTVNFPVFTCIPFNGEVSTSRVASVAVWSLVYFVIQLSQK